MEITSLCDYENKAFDLGDGTGPAEESRRTKRVQGWSCQIGLGTLFAIHTKLQDNVCGLCRCELSYHSLTLHNVI